MRKFENDAALAGVPREAIVAARYILCTFLDETAASTPWGSGGVWAKETLLVGTTGAGLGTRSPLAEPSPPTAGSSSLPPEDTSMAGLATSTAQESDLLHLDPSTLETWRR